MAMILTDIPVLNAGGWFGKTWLLEIGGSYSPLFLIVEADSMTDAIDELADNEKYGHKHCLFLATTSTTTILETCHYSGSGQVLDLDQPYDLWRRDSQATICLSLLC